jgi:predicted ATP-grasp superfamily ATP-dependent carboligase
MANPIIILGASARAAAFSALRAGFAPWTADLFADADLAARCPARRVNRYPADLEYVAREAPPGPWMYTGALENHPELVDRMAAERTLWGNAEDSLRQVRDPWMVRDALAADGLPAPDLHTNPMNLPPGVWMRKLRRSAGGMHLQRIETRARKFRKTSAAHPDAGIYYQQFVPGIPTSAVFVAARGRAVLLGATRQLVGEPWTGARGFQYAGSIGPMPLSESDRESWRRIGNCLARRFSLTGLFGVDAVANSEGIFPVEVNPRYTASIEVLERSPGTAAFALHAAVCQQGRLPEAPSAVSPEFCGKAVIYARHSGPAGEPFWDFVRQANDGSRWPAAADLPNRGEHFRIGHPVLTLFERASSEADVLQRLRARADRVFTMMRF